MRWQGGGRHDMAASRLADPAASALRRTGWQLAALLVGLLSALLIALIAVVYFRTASASLASLQDTLRTRAASEAYHLTDRALSLRNQPPVHESTREEQERGEIVIVFADVRLSFLGGTANPFGQALPDRQAAAAAIAGGGPAFSARELRGDLHYRIYTLPVVRGGRTLGVVQTAASARVYEQGLHALLGSLLLVGALGLLAAAAITAVVVQRALLPIRAALAHQRDFVADAAHELRAPLAILRTATELWLDPESEEDRQEAVGHVLTQGAHLARLVDDLSLLARADSGAVPVLQQPLELGALVADLVAAMEVVAEDRAVSLELAIEPAWVRGDPGRIRQLGLILLDNALKFTPSGGRIAVTVARQGGHAVLRVRDRGPGIDPLDLPHLFDRFYRADRARHGEGTGLGLAIGRWIVVAHGGEIRAANAPDGGAVFTVTLPRLG